MNQSGRVFGFLCYPRQSRDRSFYRFQHCNQLEKFRKSESLKNVNEQKMREMNSNPTEAVRGPESKMFVIEIERLNGP